MAVSFGAYLLVLGVLGFAVLNPTYEAISA